MGEFFNVWFLSLSHRLKTGHWPDWILLTEWRRECRNCAFGRSR